MGSGALPPSPTNVICYMNMTFFKQLDSKSCQIVALQSVLSYYNRFPSIKDIKTDLPKHSFGNFITELATYLELHDINTTLVSNMARFRKGNKLFFDSLNDYSLVGKYEDRYLVREDLNNGPIIVNVDWYKVKSEGKGIGAHYVVILKNKTGLFMYDGSNFDEPKLTTFEDVLRISKSINRWNDDGMFLVCNSV